MRAWILIALSRAGLGDAELPFVLEALDTGRHAHVVAAAARALRTYPQPTSAFAAFLVRALANIRYHDERVAFERYGDTAGAASPTAVQELLATLEWLGPHSANVPPEVAFLRKHRGDVSRKLRANLDRALAAFGRRDSSEAARSPCGCLSAEIGQRSWTAGARRGGEGLRSIAFEDHDGAPIRFGEFLQGQPAIVAFFYTRCDNPQKCSLTITKLARVQRLLAEREVADRIRTAAITYDPAFDVPERLRAYGKSRGLHLDRGHRMLRPCDGIDEIRRQFSLGVSFIESIVNHHRIEVYLVDSQAAIAAAFERIHWSEEEVVSRAVALLEET
jgi:protein SCO1/2